MHVYLREEPVELVMLPVDTEGLVDDEAGLIAIAFYANANERPSFRALLPPETVAVLEGALQEPVQLGLLAEEPEEGEEVRAMVGISVPVQGMADKLEIEELGGEEEASEPWRSDPEAWRGEADEEEGDGVEMPRTALLAFAPLVRLTRRFPESFGEELADLLESALAGATRPSLEARVDKMLGDL
jgi:hypothetical protein